MPGLFSVSNGSLATEHTIDRAMDTTSLPGGRGNAQVHINKVRTILFQLHRAQLILTDGDYYNDINEGYLSCYYHSFYFLLPF